MRCKICNYCPDTDEGPQRAMIWVSVFPDEVICSHCWNAIHANDSVLDGIEYFDGLEDAAITDPYEILEEETKE